jgi:hypothetical protein
LTDSAKAGRMPDFWPTIKRCAEPCCSRVEAVGLADKEVILAGHSLGGALSTLAAHDLAEEDAPNTTFRHYTFGAPRVFNPRLARYYNDLPVSTYRIVNVEDAVTTVPLPVSREADLSTRGHADLLFGQLRSDRQQPQHGKLSPCARASGPAAGDVIIVGWHGGPMLATPRTAVPPEVGKNWRDRIPLRVRSGVGEQSADGTEADAVPPGVGKNGRDRIRFGSVRSG